jgi:hypothetical protein
MRPVTFSAAALLLLVPATSAARTTHTFGTAESLAAILLLLLVVGLGTPGPRPLRAKRAFATLGLALLTVAVASCRSTSADERDAGQEEEPIAYIGHGAFFDRTGRQIVPTEAWVARAQRWYRDRLVARVDPGRKREFETFERRLEQAFDAQGQTRLVVRQRALDWLVARMPRTVENLRMQAKVNLLASQLRWQLPRGDQDLERMRNLEPYRLDSSVVQKLSNPEFRVQTGVAFLVTSNSGQAYLNECANAGVPIPPSIGVLDPPTTPGWRSLGFIPQNKQFIVGTPAEVRVFENGQGMCIALPRYTNNARTDVALDGVICLSRTTSKVCFWDNQMNGAGFSFPAGTQVPIGVANPAVNPAGLYQGGGAEIEFGNGGICTDCHAGENPYIIHPEVTLLSGTGTPTGTDMDDLDQPPLNLPMFAPDRYDPIVGASWPQNQLSHAPALVPPACTGCHSSGASGGRLPHLSSDIPGYCGTVLATALDGQTTPLTVSPTMPQFGAGSLSNDPVVNTFQGWCASAATAGPSTRGDPHLTTTNGINYDFQAAGEFVSLRNSDTGFELQTRQTPVLTTFTPDANAHTGLASCVSLNTAAALRVGRHRISYQPVRGGRPTPEQMQLRIDGRAVLLTGRGVSLGGGNRIGAVAAGGGLDVRLDDGTRVVITSNYWASQGYWYLNIEVIDSPAREGTMGTILRGNWLPLSPAGTSYGPAPAAVAARHDLLNRVFADDWRVTAVNSLFDYGPGESTVTFTSKSWPPPPGGSCASITGNPWPGAQPRRPVQPMDARAAERLCRPIENPAARANCVFDLTATGEAAMVEAYRRSLMLRGTP